MELDSGYIARASAPFRVLETDVRENAGHVYVITAGNAKRIGTVDHTRDGVFLFNYFYADSPAQNLPALEQTAPPQARTDSWQ